MSNDARIEVRLPEAERDRAAKVAEQAGESLSSWIRRAVALREEVARLPAAEKASLERALGIEREVRERLGRGRDERRVRHEVERRFARQSRSNGPARPQSDAAKQIAGRRGAAYLRQRGMIPGRAAPTKAPARTAPANTSDGVRAEQARRERARRPREGAVGTRRA